MLRQYSCKYSSKHIYRHTCVKLTESYHLNYYPNPIYAETYILTFCLFDLMRGILNDIQPDHPLVLLIVESWITKEGSEYSQ